MKVIKLPKEEVGTHHEFAVVLNAEQLKFLKVITAHVPVTAYRQAWAREFPTEPYPDIDMEIYNAFRTI
jgi:hypothetical protein